MKSYPQSSAKIQIRNLLLVIGSALIFGFAMAALMLIGSGPSGIYRLKNVLLSPQSAEKLVEKPTVFDHFEFTYWDAETKQWAKLPVDFSQYEKFYAFIEGDQSLQDVSGSVLDNFQKDNLAILTLFVRTTVNPSHSYATSFQNIQFALEKDLYRVELHIDSTDEAAKWVYFYHPGLKERVLNTFKK